MKRGFASLIPALLALFFAIPGFWTLSRVIQHGPGAWTLSQAQPWGVPVASFVFWIGLAHAGTFFSAVLLLMDKPWRKPLALLAERATLAAWVAAALYPVLHLGVPTGAVLLFPHAEARGIGVHPVSPLFWDFLAIGSYGVLSLGFYLLERYAAPGADKTSRMRALAWLLTPLVVTVHSVVSLNFATTRVTSWAQEWLPAYFLVGALYSGVAWVMLASALPGFSTAMYNERHEETELARKRLAELLLGLSWLLAAFWSISTLRGHAVAWPLWIAGFLVPQLFWIPRFAACRLLRSGVALVVLGTLYWERLDLVLSPMPGLGWADWGWACLGASVFLAVLAILGWNDGKEVSLWKVRRFWARGELPLALAGGILAVLGLVWKFGAGLSWWAILPGMVSLALLVAGAGLLVRASYFSWRKAMPFLPVGLAAGAVLALALTVLVPAWDERPRAPLAGPQWSAVPSAFAPASGRPVADLWEGYCQVCHGASGYEKMPMRKHYPYPRKLRETAWDSMGTDSLVRVVLEGRGYMNAFGERLAPAEAQALVLWMRARIAEREAEHE